MTLGKVTDERGVEGGREVALKRRGGCGLGGGVIGKIDHRVKIPFKKIRGADGSQVTTGRHMRKWSELQVRDWGTAARPADHKCNIMCRTVNMAIRANHNDKNCQCI